MDPHPDPYTVEELDEILFIAVTCGINVKGLQRRRDQLAAESG